MTDTGPTTIAEASASASDTLDAPSIPSEGGAEQGAPPAVPAVGESGAPAAPPAEFARTEGQWKALQAESQRYREQARAWERASQSWHPDDRAVVLQLLELSATDPVAAAQGFAQLGVALQQQHYQTEQQRQQEPPLTMSELRKFMDSQAEEQMQAQQVNLLRQEAQQLGYTLDTPEYLAFLQYAANFHNSDLQAAHAAATAARDKLREQWIAEYTQGKQQVAAGAPPVAPGGPAGSPAPSAPTTIAEASKLAKEALA